MKKMILILTPLILLGLFTLASGQGQDAKSAREVLMKKKLDSAQKVLEGLAVRDFDLIEKHADNLVLLSKKAEFLVLKTPDYQMYSDDFRRNAEKAATMARQKNLDGAALSYVALTMNCVNCHKHVREVRMASGDSRPGWMEALKFEEAVKEAETVGLRTPALKDKAKDCIERKKAK